MTLSHALLLASSLLLPALAAAQDPGAPPPRGVEYVQNRGQWPEAVRHRVDAGPLTTWLLDGGWVVQAEEARDDGIAGVAVRMTFDDLAGALDRPARPLAVDATRLPGVRHYLHGQDRERWVTHVPSFARVVYPDAFPGIDVVMREQAGVVEYDLVATPGSDLRTAAIRCAGHESLSIAKDGSLVVHTALGEIRQKPPRTWATLVDGTRLDVEARFVLVDEDRFGFAVDAWPAEAVLTIDPGLVWASYFGSSGRDQVTSIEFAPNGDMVVAGHTDSGSFPTTAGAYQRTHKGGCLANGRPDGTISRFKPDGTLVFSTFLGSSCGDFINDCVVAADGTIWVCGNTNWNSSFPTTSNRLMAPRGLTEGFVARISADGASLLFGTLFGHPGDNTIDRIAFDDTTKRLTMVGSAYRGSGDIPLTATAYQRSRPAGYGLFLTVVDFSTPATPTIRYSTYFGKSGSYTDTAMHVDANGVATLAGRLGAVNDMPTTANAFLSSAPNRDSFFLVRIDPNRSGAAGLLYASYLGVSTTNAENGVVGGVHADANGIVTFTAGTRGSGWPITSNALDATFNSGAFLDAVLLRIDTTRSKQNALVYGTYLGNSNNDRPCSLSIDGSGLATLGMSTSSSGLPTTPGSFQRYGFATRWVRYETSYIAQIDLAQATPVITRSTYFGSCGNHTLIDLAVSGDLVALAANGQAMLPVTPNARQQSSLGQDEFHLALLDLRPVSPSTGSFGAACTGSKGTPLLEVSRPGRLCDPNQLTLRMSNLPTNRPGVVFLGLSNTSWGSLALPLKLDFLGMTGCAVNVSLDTSFTQFTGNGTTTWGFVVPGNPWLIGKKVYFQYAFADPGANRVGVVMTNGVWNELRW